MNNFKLIRQKDFFSYYFYYCFFYSQKELDFAKSYLQYFLKKDINRLFRPAQKNNIKNMKY